MDAIAATLGLYAVALDHTAWGCITVVCALLFNHLPLETPFLSSVVDLVLSIAVVLFPPDVYSGAALIVLAGSIKNG